MPETVTSAFPDKRVQWGMKGVWQTQTDIIEAQGREQRRVRGPMRRILQGDLEYLDQTARAVVGNFLRSRSGPNTPFYIYEWAPSIFVNNSGGNGRLGAANWGANYGFASSGGTITVFTFPMGNPGGNVALATTLQAAYAAGVQYPASLLVGGGTYGEDRVQFTIPATMAAPTIGAAGNPNGTYSYVYTQVISGNESFRSAQSANVSPASKVVNLSGISVGPAGCTARKVYRCVAGNNVAGPWLLLTTIANNTTTVYTDNVADGSLGAASPLPAPPTGANQVEFDVTGRLRVPVRLMTDAQGESFVVSSQILGLRHLDVIEVL